MQRSELMVIVQNIIRDILSQENMEKCLEAILYKATFLMSTEDGVIGLADKEQQLFTRRFGAGRGKTMVGYTTDLNAGVFGKVWRSKRIALIQDYHSWDQRVQDPSFDFIEQVVGVPLIVQNKILGILGIIFPRDRKIKETEMNIMDLFGSLASMALSQCISQDQLRQQAQILDQVQDSIIVTDEAGFIRYWNHWAEKLYDYESAEVLGKHISLLADSEKEREAIKQVIYLTKKVGAASVELLPVAKNRMKVPVHLRTSILRDEQENISGIIGFGTDLRNAENAMMLLNKYEQTEQQRLLFSQIFDGVVTDGEEIAQKSFRCGLRPDTEYEVAVIGGDEIGSVFSTSPADIRSSVRDLLVKFAALAGVCAWERDEGIIVLRTCRQERKSSTQSMRDLVYTLAGEAFTKPDGSVKMKFAVGISAKVFLLRNARQHFSEASQAMWYGLLICGEGAHVFSEIGVFQLLAPLSREHMDGLVRNTVGVLREEDEKMTEPFYLLTLRTILTESSIRECAAKLFVHEKTIFFRRKKIEQLLGVSLERPEHRLALKIALGWSDRNA